MCTENVASSGKTCPNVHRISSLLVPVALTTGDSVAEQTADLADVFGGTACRPERFATKRWAPKAAEYPRKIVATIAKVFSARCIRFELSLSSMILKRGKIC